MLNWLGKLWRVLATGLCFSFFGFGGIVLSLIVFPIQRLFVREPVRQKQIARQTVHYTFKFFVGLMALTGVFKFKLKELAHLKDLRGHLVLANHPSLIDVVVLISIIPNTDCVVKAHLFSNPFLRGVVTGTGYISNAEPDGLITDCEESLRAGNNLVVFPEGTRTKPGQDIAFQRGAANIALRCKAPITAVSIDVNPSSLTKSEPWYAVPKTQPHFVVKELINPPQIPAIDDEHVSKQARQYSTQLETFFRQAF